MNRQIDPWKQIMAGDYSQAADSYLRHFEINKDLSDLSNAGLAFLMMKDYLAALHCFEKIIEQEAPERQSQSEYVGAGICCWCLNCVSDAVQWWKASLSVPYTDAAGGLVPIGMLLFASYKLGDPKLIKESNELLNKFWESGKEELNAKKTRKETHNGFAHANLRNWPGIIVPFLVDQIQLSDVKNELLKTEIPILRSRYECQYYFYNALKALMNNEKKIYQQNMLLCADIKDAILEDEYHLARHEAANF